MNTAVAMRRPDEIGVPDPLPLMHPLMVKNYGAWAWHDRPRPGVLHHVAKSGDEIWTVRAGTQRQMDVFTIRNALRHRRQIRRRACPLHHPLQHRVHDRRPGQGHAADRRARPARLPGRGHRQFGVDDLAHPGLAALRHSRHRRLRRGEEPDGHDAPGIHQGGNAQPRAHHDLLLPDQLRRPGRHIDQCAIHQAAEDQS